MSANLNTAVPVVLETEQISVDQRFIALAQALAMGFKTVDIAAQLSVSEAWVREHKKDAAVVKMVSDLQAEALANAKTILATSSALAAQRLTELLDDPKGSVALGAANSILDRNGLKSPDKVEHTNNLFVGVMTTEEIKANLKSRMAALQEAEQYD